MLSRSVAHFDFDIVYCVTVLAALKSSDTVKTITAACRWDGPELIVRGGYQVTWNRQRRRRWTSTDSSPESHSGSPRYLSVWEELGLQRNQGRIRMMMMMMMMTMTTMMIQRLVVVNNVTFRHSLSQNENKKRRRLFLLHTFSVCVTVVPKYRQFAFKFKAAVTWSGPQFSVF